MSSLYTVLDESNILDGEHVEVFTTIARAGTHRDELRQMADDNSDSEANFRVYQLADPDSGLAPLLEPFPMSPQMLRLEAARLAVKHHEDEGADDVELVGTTDALAKYIADATMPADEDDEPSTPVIEIRRPDGDHIEIWVDGEQVAAANQDEHGTDGMQAVESAALCVARAFDVEPESTGPGAA